MYDKDSELAISQQLVDHLPYEVMWLNEAGELVYANNMFFKKMGYKRTDVPGLTIFDINPTTDAKSLKRHWSAVKKKGIVDFKDTHKTRKGKLYEVEVFAQFL